MKFFRFLLIAALSFLSSCYYTFQNNRLEGIETVHINPVVNMTIKYEIGDLLTKEINENFMNVSSLRIANESDADAVITIKVKEYRKETGSIDNEGNPTSFRIIFHIDFSLIKGEEIVESAEDYKYEKIFEYNQSLSETELIEQGVSALADDITEQILEGF